MNFFRSRKFRQGTAATVFTILVIVLAVIVNSIVAVLSARYNMALDLSEGGIFSLSNESREFLGTVEKDVLIYVLSDEEAFINSGAYFVQANEIISRYAKQQPRITVRYIDILKDPDFTAAYPDLTLSAGNILVTSGERAVALTAFDLFNTSGDYASYNSSTQITSSKAEQALSSAILNVTSDRRIMITVLEGHNEENMDAFIQLLQKNNYDVVTQNLMTEELNTEAAAIIMCAPSRDITENESRKLDAFLSNGEKLGKTFFYLASVSQQQGLPVLDAFLAEWGIQINPGTVYESNPARLFQMNIFTTIADYMEDKYSESVAEKKLVPVIAYSRPLELVPVSNTNMTGLLEFSATAGIMPPDAGEDWTPERQVRSEPILALCMGQRTEYDGQLMPVTSTVLVSGSDILLDPMLLGSANISNSEYMLELLGSLSGRDDVIHIQDKTIGAKRLPVTFAQIAGISIALTVICPVLVMIAGIVVWLRRRHR